MDPDEQQRLHAENQQAIASICARLDTLMAQTEQQSAALRAIIGGALTDTEALIRFREEHRRFQRYDQSISDATQTLMRWIGRAVVVGGIALMLVGLAANGVGDVLRGLFKPGS